MHKSGFVNIVGFPNVGKSTLLNRLLNDKLVIVSPKVQTTRQRILGIYNDDNSQIVFSDTPGFITNPHYELHKTMNSAVHQVFQDADILMLITEPNCKEFGELGEKVKSFTCPLIIIINKADTSTVPELNTYAEWLLEEYPKAQLITISALHKFNIERIIPTLQDLLPEHPPYFPKDIMSDRNVRFFVSEIIRENILLLYHKEIPYSSEVIIEDYKEMENISKIYATIYVERESQKMIILGKNGSAIKQLGIQSRLSIEKFIEQRVHLDITVKVLKNWRNDQNILKKLGYQI